MTGPSDPISEFMEKHFLHFNAGALMDAARGYVEQMESGNRMIVCLGGAMSTAELGKSLAEMIREEKVHFISCTGANLEEDVMNLVAHDSYKRIPEYRDLTPDQEKVLFSSGLNRVTDTCIPEEQAIRLLEASLTELWSQAHNQGQSKFPHEYFYDIIRSGALSKHYQIDPEDSWVVAASEKNLPMVVPGWEDSTMGNILAAKCIEGTIDSSIVKSGLDYMVSLATWYESTTMDTGVGFFQIGGGIAGDFPICVVPMLRQDLGKNEIPFWSYFCQISDSITSYGSYSGATPNEKITWGKLDVDTPRFVVESDATIVVPLIFSYVLSQ